MISSVQVDPPRRQSPGQTEKGNLAFIKYSQSKGSDLFTLRITRKTTLPPSRRLFPVNTNAMGVSHAKFPDRNAQSYSSSSFTTSKCSRSSVSGPLFSTINFISSSSHSAMTMRAYSLHHGMWSISAAPSYASRAARVGLLAAEPPGSCRTTWRRRWRW